MKHRGRIQAQGENLEASESWSQNDVPTKEDGLKMLDKLKNKITKKEAKIRKNVFKDACKYIERASLKGGLSATVFKSFNVKGENKERIDIEVISGLAFVDRKTKKTN